MKTLLRIVVAFLMVASLLSCGQPGSTNTSEPPASPVPASPVPDSPALSTTPSTPTLTKYQFTAKIEGKWGDTPFPSAVGDAVTGTFSFDPSGTNAYVSPTEGNHVQETPAGVRVVIGSVTINADLANWLGYVISIRNNDPDYSALLDVMTWYVNDTNLAASYGLDYIQVVFRLSDSTGKAFDTAALPSDIKLSSFDANQFFLSGNKTNNNTATQQWLLRGVITSLEKVQ